MNGVNTILFPSSFFDGKKVDGRNLQPGIYISNGKKFVVGR